MRVPVRVMLDRTSLPSVRRPVSQKSNADEFASTVSVTWTRARGGSKYPYGGSTYILGTCAVHAQLPLWCRCPRRSCCSLPWDVSFCSIQSSQLLLPSVRHAFPSSLSSVLSSRRLHRWYNGGASCPIPRPSQFALTPLLGRATWDDCGLCNGRREDPVHTASTVVGLAVLACLLTGPRRSWRAHVPGT